MSKTLRVCLFVVALASVAGAQDASAPKQGAATAASPPELFTSTEGGFRIALPRRITGYGPVSIQAPGGGVASGDSFTWSLEGTQYNVSHVETPGAPTPDEAKVVLEAGARAAADELTRGGGKLVAETKVPLGGHEGRELRFDFRGREAVLRLFIVGNRGYQLRAIHKNDEAARASAARVLDSFRLLTAEEVAEARRRKVAEATPSPLPQEPAAKILKSDAEDEGLKGKVKSVFVERENLSATSSPAGGRKPSRTDYYDARGQLTRKELYDHKGNVYHVTVYGYLDGERASADGTILNEYDPPPVAASPPPAGSPAPPKRDPRFSRKYRDAYDARGRLAERVHVNNAGETQGRHVYKYEGDRREISVYLSNGLLGQKSAETFDAKGNKVEEAFYDVRNDTVRVRYTYSYDAFDARGNWTKMTTTRWVEREGKPTPAPESVTYRTITYY